MVLKECRLMNLSRETLEKWYGEVEILKRLDHPNIVRAQNAPEGLNCSPMSNTPFICMEYCDGGDLRQVGGRREGERGEGGKEKGRKGGRELEGGRRKGRREGGIEEGRKGKKRKKGGRVGVQREGWQGTL